jgi:hypothetical protein
MPGPVPNTTDVQYAPWLDLQVHWEQVAGRLEPIAVTVTRTDGKPLQSSDLRVPLGRVVDQARVSLYTGSGKTASVLAAATGQVERAATIYREALATTSAPTRTVAEALGISRQHAATLVHRARARGLLPPTRQGRARADLGDP